MNNALSITVPPYVADVAGALTRAGHRAYLVGGSLRDLLRGVPPHDYDLTTDATPEEMLAAFTAFRVIPTGFAHGTVTVLSEGNPVEVTTHRTDGVYRDSRHPESVTFSRSLVDDLSRRDFTVNAMAWSPQTGLVDLFGGQADLAAGVLRAVGEPEKRFTEDALRILRAFRFSAQLDFAIDPATLAGARVTRAGLSHISAERIFAELTRLLEAPAAARGIAALAEAGCVPYVFFDTVPDLTLAPRLALLPPRAAVRLAALLHAETPARVRALCARLRTSNAFAAVAAGLAAALADPLPQSEYEARRYAVSHWVYLDDLFSLAAFLGLETKAAQTLVRTVVRDKTAVEPRRLAVNGRELQEIGVRPAETAKMLAYLLDLVWRKPQKNHRADLLAAAKEKMEERE